MNARKTLFAGSVLALALSALPLAPAVAATADADLPQVHQSGNIHAFGIIPGTE